MDAREEAEAALVMWRANPVQFVRDHFKVEPDGWQKKVLMAAASRDPRTQRIAMKACKGPGKTAVEAWVIWWFLTCMGGPGTHPKGAATSITEDNINDNLWPELSKWQQRAPALLKAFEWQKTRIINRRHPTTWWFSKRTWPKSGDPTAQANTLAGLHEDNILFVLDESGGIPGAVMATAEGGLANADPNDVTKFAKILQGGNPTHLEGPLWDACSTHAHLWTVVEVSSDPDDPDRTSRVSKEWARQQIEMYGRDNPWVLVNVFGKFPPASLNTLLGPDEVKEAMERGLKVEDYNWSQKRLGVDVARFGDDRTVIFPRQGLCSYMPVVLRNMRTTMIAARVMKARNDWDAELITVDDTGHWGHGVIDNLLTAGVDAIPVIFSDPALDLGYLNRRAEMWFGMAEWVKGGGALPFVSELIAELTTPTYTFHRSGKIQLEEKDQIKSRLGRSPDLADALALTFALPDMPGNRGFDDREVAMAMGALTSKTRHEYDPLEVS